MPAGDKHLSLILTIINCGPKFYNIGPELEQHKTFYEQHFNNCMDVIDSEQWPVL
jgi:hypothetical protein